MHNRTWILTCVAVTLFCLSWAEAENISIVVNIGPYPSARAAADDEEHVNWLDADTGDDTICTECFAACQLQQYLGKITGNATGGKIVIVDDGRCPASGDLVLLGNSSTNRAIGTWAGRLNIQPEDYAELGPEGYLIWSREVSAAGEPARRVMIIGGKGRVGTLYGVYRLLDYLGVRWFSPGETGEEIPAAQGTVSLPLLRLQEKPAFAIRGFHAWEDRADLEFYDWMARNRMNFWCVESSNHPALFKRGILLNYGNGHALQSLLMNPRQRYPYNHLRFSGDENLPQDPYPISKQYRGDVNHDNKLSYCEAHPEWYGLRNGKRSFRIHGDVGDNFCTSNRDACREFIGRVVQEFIKGRWKDASSLNFWMLDGGKWCECAACRALGSPTDRLLLLVHQLRQGFQQARRDRRLHRTIQIYFPIYAETIVPPTRPLPAGFDYRNCIGTYFPIDRCHYHGIFDSACTEFNTRFMKRLQGWALAPDRYYRGQLFIGEYYNVSRYKSLPMVFSHVMSLDIPYYYDIGARYMHYMHVKTRNWGPMALTNYQFARMLWNPHLDYERLLQDYFSRKYHSMAPRMRRMYRLLEYALGNAFILKYRLPFRLNRMDDKLFVERHMQYEKTMYKTDNGPDWTDMMHAIDQCRVILKEVKSMSQPGKLQARLAEDEAMVEYAANTLHFYDGLIRAITLIHKNRIEEARKLLPALRQVVAALQNDTESTKWSSSHANAANALEASFAAPAWQKVLQTLMPTANTNAK